MADDKVSGEKKDAAEDPIESAIGAFGKWQLCISVALALIKVPIAWHQLEIVLLAPPANFSCVSYNDSADDQCSANGTKCTEWEYDRSVFRETIITEWDLVCDRAQLANVAQTIFMFGVLLGSALFGMAADKFGRKIPLMISVILQAATGIATAYVPVFTGFLALRFFDALATGGQMVVSFVICMEMIGQKWRTLVSVLYHLPFNIGHSILPVVSYFLRDWREFQLAISAPSILMLLYWWVIPESPRWLLTVGRRAEALAVLEKGARINKLPKPALPDEKMGNSKPDKEEGGNEKKAVVFDLFRTPNLRTRTLCIYFNWLAAGLCFFGLAQYMGQIGGNIFLNVAISGLIELPGALTCTFLMERYGRRLTVMGSNLLSGVACLLIMAVPEGGSHWPRVVLAALGMVGTSVSFPTIYLYSGEIFPTVVRNVGIGTSSMCARIGSMIAPFVTSLAIWSKFLPPLTFGVIPLIGALLTLLLPETARTVLPNTIEEGENFGKPSLQGTLNKSFDGD
ncbi:UNVERIFIED_CONTAM: hypothetical protein PYX00_003790 [Menopon gallinae]|uniref:Major facilitator superfamily (MFS) profile domain-containing protein n=1 Tax=Menopon gallinae TaxID=328185 RepID=A0AAW2I2C7_9NEOP